MEAAPKPGFDRSARCGAWLDYVNPLAQFDQTRKALATNPTRWPRKVTLDGHVPSHCALRLLRRENPKWKYVEVRSCKYLNNIVEQDHRAIKRRCASMAGFKSFATASITIAGIELAHRIHRRQFSFGPGRRRRGESLKHQLARALA